jgi:ferredoxin
VKLIKLPPDSTSYWLPAFVPQPGGQRGMFSPATYRSAGGPVSSSCLGCIDAPCRLFAEREVMAPVLVDTPVYPDRSVCPADALIAMGDSAVPEVDEGLCIGCGLCVARCPVGAIHIDPTDAPYELAADEFTARRERLSLVLSREIAPFPDSELVGGQLARIDEYTVKGEEQRTFRMLARNVFLALGYPARLKNPGDNNAFSELVIDVDDALILLEIETGGDTLDAFRRSLSGWAIALSRYKVSPDRAVPGVVLDRLPNTRVDYYEAVKNTADRIGVALRTIPVAALLLGLRSGDDRLLRFVKDSAVADSDRRSLEADAGGLWGGSPNSGFSPGK